MTRRVLRVLIEVEGASFDPDDTNPYADSQAELEAVLSSNLQTITSMDAGDVITLRDTNGNRCGKVEMEDFPGNSPMLPYWTRLSDLALDVEEEFPVAKFLEQEAHPLREMASEPPAPAKRPAPRESNDEEAARAFDEGRFAEPPRVSSHEHIAEPDPGDPVIPTRPRRGGNPNVPPPPGGEG